MIAYITTHGLSVNAYSVSTVLAEMSHRGIRVKFFDISLDDIRKISTPDLIYVCHPMLSWMVPLYEEMKSKGSIIISDIQSSMIASDKWLSYQALVNANIKTPKTQLIEKYEIPNVGWPCIVKPTCRWFGEGSSFVSERKDIAFAYLNASKYRDNQVIAQEYLDYMHNLVIVANMIGDNVFSCYMSIGRGGFMSAINEYDRAVVPMQPNSDVVEIAKSVIKTIPIDIARMEMMMTPDGPSIIDINPGGARTWVDICSQKNSAKYLVDHLLNRYQILNDNRNYS